MRLISEDIGGSGAGVERSAYEHRRTVHRYIKAKIVTSRAVGWRELRLLCPASVAAGEHGQSPYSHHGEPVPAIPAFKYRRRLWSG